MKLSEKTLEEFGRLHGRLKDKTNEELAEMLSEKQKEVHLLIVDICSAKIYQGLKAGKTPLEPHEAITRMTRLFAENLIRENIKANIFAFSKQ